MKRIGHLQRSADRGTKSTVLGISVNLGLGLGKCSAGLLGNSFALVADGLESIADVFDSLVVYFGLKISAKPPDADHPYGHGKAEPIAALVVSLALMATAFGIIYEGIREIISPHGTPAPYTLVVLAGVLIIKDCCSGTLDLWAKQLAASPLRVTLGTTEVMRSHQRLRS